MLLLITGWQDNHTLLAYACPECRKAIGEIRKEKKS